MTPARTLVIGCGNLLRGDDAAGPVLVRRMWERGLPEGVHCADGGTGGMDVAFQMRGMPEVILVDACRSGSDPGTLFEVPGHEVESLPPLTGINLHAFRWDHAIAFGRWLLKGEYPEKVTAYLVEGESFEPGAALSPAVDRAVDRLASMLCDTLARRRGGIDLPRPQPVGVRPFPESHALLPGPGRAARLVDEYNRFLHGPTPLGLAMLLAADDPTITPLARAAAFAHGLVDELPEPGPLDGELRALVLMTAAAGLIERGERPAARGRLLEAVDTARGPSPAFAAVLEMQLADLVFADDPPSAAKHLRAGITLAELTDLPLLAAELWMKLGLTLQSAGGDRPTLLEAVNAYQMAIRGGITAESHPDWFGQIHNNLGLAYLSMPTHEAGDQLRTAIALQSFRHALRVQDREQNPDMWATVSMNLANALQYLPSSHPQENLVQAVEAYEQVLAVRTEARDPAAHALVLLNQANALAHLGIFKPAIENAAHAYKLLSWHGQEEPASAARELHDTIHARLQELRDAPAQGANQSTGPGAPR